MCAFPSGFLYVATVTYDKTNLCLNQEHTDIVNTRLMTMSKDALLELQRLQQVEWIVTCAISPSHVKRVVRNQRRRPEMLDFKLGLLTLCAVQSFLTGKLVKVLASLCEHKNHGYDLKKG